MQNRTPGGKPGVLFFVLLQGSEKTAAQPAADSAAAGTNAEHPEFEQIAQFWLADCRCSQQVFLRVL